MNDAPETTLKKKLADILRNIDKYIAQAKKENETELENELKKYRQEFIQLMEEQASKTKQQKI